MNKPAFFILLILLQALFVMARPTAPSVCAQRCEYLENPLGIDVPEPRFSWQISGNTDNLKQTAYEISVALSPEGLKQTGKLIWSSGKILSDQSVNVLYKGPQLQSRTRYFWSVRIWDNKGQVSEWSEVAWWETAFMDNRQWHAKWITARGKTSDDHRPVYFRKEFQIGKNVKSARLYVSSHGLYQVFLNGAKVGNDLFTPGWTSYRNRLQYQTYDITSLLNGNNALGAIVGDGWFRGNIGGNVKRNYYGDKSALIAQLEIIHSDSSKSVFITDESWVTGDGPIPASDIYNGETYDARLEMPGWSNPGFPESGFVPAENMNAPVSNLVASYGHPVRAIEEITPVKIIRTPKGETVFDMGQNMVGWVRLHVQGERGDRVVLKFAEVLDKNGNFYTDNLRAARATDEYILKGGETETYEPFFTFHGFRYVKVEQFPGKPDLQTLTGVVIHTAMPPTGTFTCSDSLINRLQENIQWGQRGNFLDIPTDCPQRDERLGWTGDAQVFAPTAAFNYHVAPFFTKWMLDLAADQLPDGKVTDVVPDVRSGRGSSAAWGDAAVIVPWTVYQVYGDTLILENQYESMKKWVGYMQQRAGKSHLWTGDSHYGDWLAIPSKRLFLMENTTSKDLIASAYYAFSTKLLAKTARILGKNDDARIYEALAENIKKAFIHEFITPSGRMESHTQTAYALALAFELIPVTLIQKAAGYLADDVRKMGRLTTGFVGTPYLCRALSENGYEDLAFTLLMRKEYPSWLYPVTMGATTIWERWDGLKPDGSFQNAAMNSFNHYAYGAIGEWLYTHIAGIKPDPENPGYKHFFLEPHHGGGLTNAKAEFQSMYGLISSSWEISDGILHYTCIIPANTSATIRFGNVSKKDILLHGQPLDHQPGFVNLSETGAVSIRAGSGKYTFSVPVRRSSIFEKFRIPDFRM